MPTAPVEMRKEGGAREIAMAAGGFTRLSQTAPTAQAAASSNPASFGTGAVEGTFSPGPLLYKRVEEGDEIRCRFGGFRRECDPASASNQFAGRAFGEEATVAETVAVGAGIGWARDGGGRRRRHAGDGLFDFGDGVVVLLGCGSLLGFIPGIMCGHLARAKMRSNPLLKGKEMATAGLAISYAMLGLVLAVFGTLPADATA